MKLAEKLYYEAKELRKQGFHIESCFLPSSLVYKEGIPTPIEDIKENDIIFSIKGKTKVIKTSKRMYRGKVVRISFRGYPVYVTQDHPILVAKYKDIRKIQQRNANRRVKIKKYGAHRKKPSFDDVKFSWSSARSLEQNDFACIPSLNFDKKFTIDLSKYNHSSQEVRVKKYQLDEESAWIFGFYLADGYGGPQGRAIRFACSLKENEYATRILTYFKKLGYGGFKKEEKKRGIILVTIPSTLFYRFFREEFGSKAQTKVIPKWIIESPYDIIKSFLDGYIAGDGCTNFKDRIFITTTSKNIMFQLFILLARMKNLPTVHIIPPRRTIIMGNVVNCSTTYTIGFPRKKKDITSLQKVSKSNFFEFKNKLFVRIDKPMLEEYCGFVYNLETKDNTFLSPFVVHNCWLTGSTYNQLKKEFLELEMGEVSEQGDVPIHKKKWKEGKEYKATTKKEKHVEGIKALDIITTLKTMIKIVPPGTVPQGGGPMVKDGNYLLRYVYVGTPEQRSIATEKVRQFNIKSNKEFKEDYGKKLARKVA